MMRTGSDLTILVIAKEPIPGKVKTRLTPALSSQQAASLAAAAIADTLAAVTATPARRRILVLDGEPGDWVPRGMEVVPQSSGGLDRRLEAAFTGIDGPAVLIGMDTPQLRPTDLQVNFDVADAWLGPANDGGWWLIGMRQPDPSVFAGVPMSTRHTGTVQEARLRATGMRVRLGPWLRDVDTIEDAHAVAAIAPATRFARTLAAMGTSSWATHDGAYARALSGESGLRLVAHDGRIITLDPQRWSSAPDAADLSLLTRCEGATLDVGCGPGRLAAALAHRGLTALGVDIAMSAVHRARAAGAAALCRSIFHEVPGEGRWDTVLLADGNLGIDGDPARLLARLREVLRPGGQLLVEPVSYEADDVLDVRLCDGAQQSELFAWGHLGPAAARRRIEAAGYSWRESWSVDGREFMSFAA